MNFPRILLVFSLFVSFHPARSQEKILDYFLSRGIKNSPLINDMNEQIRSSHTDSLLIKAMTKPRVEFRGYAFYAPVVNGFGYSEVLTNIANLTSVMSVSQQIFNKKSIEATLLRTDIQKQSLSNTLRLTETSLKRAITSAYLDALSVYSDILAGREVLTFGREQEQILKSLTESGIYRQADFLTFMIALQGEEIQGKEMTLQFRRKLSDLYILCGISDTAIFIPTKPELETPSPILRKTSPLFLRFYLDSLRILNENTLLDRNYKPSVSWFSDAGLINNEPSVIYQNFGLSLGLNFTLPVYDGNQRKLNRQKLKSEEDIRSGYSEAFKREYSQQLQQLRDELDQTRALIPTAKSQVVNSKLLVTQLKELVMKGSGSIMEYLIAIRNYLNVRKSLNGYEIRVLQIENEINYYQ
jgi:outer membrane protein TolC